MYSEKEVCPLPPANCPTSNQDPGCSTGVALIITSEKGKLSVPHKGANDMVGDEEVATLRSLLEQASRKERDIRFLVLQLEVQLGAVYEVRGCGRLKD